MQERLSRAVSEVKESSTRVSSEEARRNCSTLWEAKWEQRGMRKKVHVRRGKEGRTGERRRGKGGEGGEGGVEREERRGEEREGDGRKRLKERAL